MDHGGLEHTDSLLTEKTQVVVFGENNLFYNLKSRNCHKIKLPTFTTKIMIMSCKL